MLLGSRERRCRLSNIIPFGKHKGRELAEVAVADPEYLEWLAQQAWFVEKFKPMYLLIKAGIQAFDAETPEHNAMQARFLDEQYRRAVAIGTWFPARLEPRFAAQAVESMRKRRLEALGAAFLEAVDKIKGFGPYHYAGENPLPRVREALRSTRWRRRRVRLSFAPAEPEDPERRRILLAYLAFRQARVAILRWMPPVTCSIVVGEPKFESPTDVSFTVRRHAEFGDGGGSSKSPEVTLFIEIKPSLGDDYPAVLRQVLAQRERVAKTTTSTRDHRWVVLAGEFAASGVSFDQAKAIFGQSNIVLARTSNVAAIPSCG